MLGSATSERPTQTDHTGCVVSSLGPIDLVVGQHATNGESVVAPLVEQASIHSRVELLATPRTRYARSRPRWLELRFGLSIVSTFCVSTVLVLLGWVLIPTLFVSWNASAIESGSMEPALERGDVVVFQPAPSSTLAEQSVIRFRLAGSSDSVVHRIVGYDATTDVYTTQGDANPTADSDLVSFEQIEGVGTLLVPLVGYPLLWKQEGQYLYLLLTMIGSVLVLVSSQTAPSSVAQNRAPQLQGPLTPAHSASTRRRSASLFPNDLASRLASQASTAPAASSNAVSPEAVSSNAASSNGAASETELHERELVRR